MNGEVIVVRPDLAPTHDKTQTARVNAAIAKVQQQLTAVSEPEIEDKMQDYLLKTKERGNLSFSHDEEAATELNVSGTSTTQTSLMQLLGSDQIKSSLAVICEAI